MRRTSRFVVIVALAPLASACAALWGFEDATLLTDSSGDPSSSSGAGPGSSSGDPNSSGGSSSGDPNSSSGGSSSGLLPDDTVDPSAPVGCREREVDAGGFFVSADTGTDTSGCGRQNSPCASLDGLFAEWRRQAPDAELYVHLAAADYPAPSQWPAIPSGKSLTLDGRWRADLDGGGRRWVSYCGATPTRIGGDAVGLTFDGGAATTPDEGGAPQLDLRNLQIETSAEQAPPGTTHIGLKVQGAHIRLQDMVVLAHRGTDGAAGENGPTGSVGATNCGTTGAGADGVGTTGRDAVPTAQPASWSEQGVTYPTADVAERGGTGPNASNKCWANAACGGGGGAPGGTGGNGGSSLGVLAWRSRVEFVEPVRLLVRGGGHGGEGGLGGPGGPGGTHQELLCSSRGGKGGPGGKGSPGVGGSVACIVHGDDSQLVGFVPSFCTRSEPGNGAGAEPNQSAHGVTAEVVPISAPPEPPNTP